MYNGKNSPHYNCHLGHNPDCLFANASIENIFFKMTMDLKKNKHHKGRNCMKTNNKLLLKNKYDYWELCLKISKLRYYDEEVPLDLLFQAQRLGSLAQIPDDELNALLFDLEIQ